MREPEALLADIVEYAGRARSYAGAMTRDEFVSDTATQDAVVRCLEVIGEAARHLPDDVREAYPAVPWSQMAGLRNRLSHDYESVDMRTVWETVALDLPELLRALDAGAR